VKRSLRDNGASLSAANKACESLSNKSFRLDDQRRIKVKCVEEYCDDVDDGEASTSTVEVIPDELDIDDELLAEEMDRNYVDSHVSILSALPWNPSDLAIKGAKILKRSLQNYVDSAAPRTD
jgi:hypothetical protein